MKEKKPLKVSDIVDFVDQYNPLCLRDDKKYLKYYSTYAECYEDFLVRIALLFPTGYVDPCVLLAELYECTMTEAENEVKLWTKLLKTEEPYLLNWNDTKERKYWSERLLECASRFLNASMDKAQFEIAYEKFEKKLITLGIIKN